tara:strand:+ start:845 stop:1009 length:165 start_codon:yes stop_codon:yes gene_type:complete
MKNAIIIIFFVLGAVLSAALINRQLGYIIPGGILGGVVGAVSAFTCARLLKKSA